MVLNLFLQLQMKRWASLLIRLGNSLSTLFVTLLKMELVGGISGAVKFCHKSLIFSNRFMCSIFQSVAPKSFRFLLLRLGGVFSWPPVKLTFGSKRSFSMCSLPNPAVKWDCAKARSPLLLRWAS